MEEAIKEHFGSTQISQLVMEFGTPPNNGQTTELITKSLAFVRLYRLPDPYFRTKFKEVRESWNAHAKNAEKTLKTFHTTHTNDPKGMSVEKKELVIRHIYGDPHYKRPIALLFKESESYLRSMVKLVCDTMVKAAREINSAQVSALVYVGNRDWTSLSKWEIINVVLAAKDYFEEKRRIAAALHAAKNTATASTASFNIQQSLGHHVPSLTARQHRRNGVSEMELRARWGAGGGL